MNMSKYLPFYSNGEAGVPALARDPACVFYLPLWKKDGPAFKSDDMYGQPCANLGPVWMPQGFSFDGMDDYVNCGSHAVLNFTQAITVGAWFKNTRLAGTWQRIVNKCYNSTAVSGCCFHLGLSNTNNRYRWSVGGAFDRTSSVVCPLDSWVFHVGAWDLAVTRQYENARLIDISAAAGVVLTSAYPLTIGNAYTTTAAYPFLGIIGEVFVFNRALSQSEISSLYTATRGRYL